MSAVSKGPPWKNIEFYKSPIFFHGFYTPIKSQWIDKTPEVILNLKNGIGAKEELPVWDLAKRITNPYELIYTSSTNVSLPQSISILKPLSRSFFKLVEMLELMKFFETTKTARYRSLHLCEGPGGFIEAFLDRAQRYKKHVSNVYAMTLKQTNHTIPGWRAANRLLSRNPEIVIEYGPNTNGNILEEENQKHLEVLLKRGAHLVTADGGFDFSIDFQAQEKLVFPLLVASAKIALSTLAPSGSFILKIFDSFSDVTNTFLAFLAMHFQEYTIYKPVTSRPCNSERYFIGRFFRSFPESSRKIFEELGKFGADMEWKQEQQQEQQQQQQIIETLKTNMLTCTDKYVEVQKEALSRVLCFPEVPNEDAVKKVWSEQEQKSVQWCQAFHIASRAIRPL